MNPWNCEHPTHTIRARTILGGRVRAELQCATCGRSIRAVKFTGNVATLPPWDHAIESQFTARAQAATAAKLDEKQAERNEESREWWRWYTEYLQSPRWRDLRSKTLLRAEGRCEGCRESRATEVHHLNYDHVGDEMLFDLVAICRDCHDKVTRMERERRGTKG